MIDKEIFWLKQNKIDLPENLDWLAENEKKFLASLRFNQRQQSWKLGRWTAKQAILKYKKQLGFLEDFSITDLEITKKDNGAPSIYYQNQPVDISISLSHRENVAVCALAPLKHKIGIDIEKIEPRTKNFIEDYFTPSEQEKICKTKYLNEKLLANLFWSAKESILKALELGLSISTHEVEIKNIEINKIDKWQTFDAVAYSRNKKFLGWWKQKEYFVVTLAILELQEL